MENQKDTSLLELLNTLYDTFNCKVVRYLKISPIIDHMLLQGHDTRFGYFLILLKENNKLKLHLKESLLIKRDKQELNKNIDSYPLELFD